MVGHQVFGVGIILLSMAGSNAFFFLSCHFPHNLPRMLKKPYRFVNEGFFSTFNREVKDSVTKNEIKEKRESKKRLMTSVAIQKIIFHPLQRTKVICLPLSKAHNTENKPLIELINFDFSFTFMKKAFGIDSTRMSRSF